MSFPMPKEISIHFKAKKHEIPSDRELLPLERPEIAKVTKRLLSFNVKDQESTFFLALMKVIDAKPDEAITDELYLEALAVLKKKFLLYRYYNEEVFDRQLPGFPGYSPSLHIMQGTKQYLEDWTEEGREPKLHPASLFAKRAIQDDVQHSPLRYLSYCRDHFCHQLSLTEVQESTYTQTLFDSLEKYAERFQHGGHMTYVGFASGQFGRDALRLKLMKSMLNVKQKKPAALTLIFIDPSYLDLADTLDSQAGDLSAQAEALLIQKSVTDLAIYTKTIYGMDLSIHLFPTLSDTQSYLLDHAIDNTYICSEDFFEDEARDDVEKCYKALYRHDPLCVSFLAANDRETNTVSVEARYPGSTGPIKMKTADPFREDPPHPRSEF